MTLEKILELMKEPEKLIDPGQINLLTSYISGFISHFEEDLNEQNYQVSARWAELYKSEGKIAAAERALELEPIYQAREKTKLRIGQLGRFRSDLKDRFRVITGQKY